MRDRMIRDPGELAKAVGRTPRTVRVWRADPAFPGGRAGPWRLRRVMAFRDSLDAPDCERDCTPSARSTLRAARAKLAETRGKLLALDLAEREGRLVDRNSQTATWVGWAHRCKAALLRIPRELSARLVGLTDVEIEAALREAFGAALELPGEGRGETESGTGPATI